MKSKLCLTYPASIERSQKQSLYNMYRLGGESCDRCSLSTCHNHESSRTSDGVMASNARWDGFLSTATTVLRGGEIAKPG